MPIQIADVKKAVMPTHKMNDTGWKAVLYGLNSFSIDKSSGISTPINYVHGRYYFDIWATARINKHTKQKSSNDMEVDQFGSNINKRNRIWVLGTDGEDEGF